MRICLDLRPILPHPTGIGRVAYNLLEALQEIDDDNDYTVLHRSETFAPVPEKRNFRKIGCNIGQFSPAVHYRIPALVKRLHADLYFSPYFVIPFRLPCPAVVIVHDVIYSVYPEMLSAKRRIFYQMLTRMALRTAAAVTTDSEQTRKDLLKHYPSTPAGKVRTAYIAADQRFRPLPDPDMQAGFRLRHALPERYFCYVGNYRTHKNLGALVSAFAQVKGAVPQHLVLLDNPGQDCARLKEMVRSLSVEDRVHFCPKFPDSDLPLLYNCADAFVFPSLYEGFGLPPLEAMACGTPVITSNASSIPEVVGDAGVMVDPHKPDELADALLKVLSDPALRARMREKGLEQAAMFNWKRTAAQMLKIFSEVRRTV